MALVEQCILELNIIAYRSLSSFRYRDLVHTTDLLKGKISHQPKPDRTNFFLLAISFLTNNLDYFDNQMACNDFRALMSSKWSGKYALMNIVLNSGGLRLSRFHILLNVRTDECSAISANLEFSQCIKLRYC
jgi:hypothetical protein